MERIICSNYQSPGDILMLTAAVRDLHRAYPNRFEVGINTSCEDIWKHNPLVTPISAKDCPKDWLPTTYGGDVPLYQMNYPQIHRSNQEPYHFLHGFTQDLEQKLKLRIRVTDYKGDIYFTKQEIDTPSVVETVGGYKGKYWIMMAGGKQDYTTKWWSPASYQAVVDHFKGRIQFVQCGEKHHFHRPLNGVVNMVGKTKLREFMLAVYHAEGVVCPVTFAMHLAAAVPPKNPQVSHKPCVVGNTVVATKQGLYRADNLVNKPFNALLHGGAYSSAGFWHSGYKETITIKTKTGRALTLTHDHLVMTDKGWVEASNLTKQHKLIINNHRSFAHCIDKSTEEFARGYCLGNFVGDGTVDKSSARMSWFGKDKLVYLEDGLKLISQAGWNLVRKHRSKSQIAASINSPDLYNYAVAKGCFNPATNIKELTENTISGSWNYLSGLAAGYFDADGTVTSTSAKGASIRLHSISLKNLELVQIVLNAFGVDSKIYKLTSRGHALFNGRKYQCKQSYCLHVTGDSLNQFLKHIPLRNTDKLLRLKTIEQLRTRKANKAKFYDELISITEAGKANVYDCSVPKMTAFDANSFYVHNCVVIAGGREPPAFTFYNNHQYLHNIGCLPCSQHNGCWRSRAQKIGDGDEKDRERLCEQPIEVEPNLHIAKCMTLIKPEDVCRAIERHYEGGALSYLES